MAKKRITQSERVLVSVDKTGKTYYVWHKCLNSEPIMCPERKLRKTIREVMIKAGKIDITKQDVKIEPERHIKAVKGVK